ncbi:hypothetical protein D6825_01900 [Candidatus Woesearchaeota archaeon]|nr:MAG: hypothetical protein D6825_01900 [Candidatus Woesearchaeota archaeon]
MSKEILSQTPINSAILFDELKKIKKRDGELGFRAQKALDFCESMHIMEVGKAQELYEKLSALGIPRLRDVHFNKLIDVLPTSAGEVKVALQGYNVTVSQDNCKKIADLIAQYAQ